MLFKCRPSGKPVTVTNSYIRTIKYEYDTSGNKVKMTTPEGKEIKYTYDVSHRLIQIKPPSPLAGEGGGEGEKFSFTYDTTGRRTKLIYPNGVTTSYSYDSIGRLTNLLTQHAELREQGKKKPPILKLHTIDSFTYTHDKVGNRLSKTETDKKYDYSYDTIYRLLQSMPSKARPELDSGIRHNGEEREFEHKAEVFTYDAVGNRLTGPKEKLSYTYNTANQLTELTKQKKDEEERKREFTYDKNGNLTKKIEYDDKGNIKTITLYTYDFENRLIRIEIQRDGREKIVTFTYDPFGRRLSKIIHRHEIDDNNEKDVILSLSKDDAAADENEEDHHHTPRTTYYVYDNEDIILEYNHKGKVTARYVHGLGIDEPLAVEKRIHTHHRHHSHTYYYHFDGLGSVTALTDAKGKAVQRYDYDSFGKLRRHGHKVKQPYTYTAREYDRETGLYYYRARYYDAKVGRFISFDPILKGINHIESTSCNQSINTLPIQNPQEFNPYVYTLNNPLRFIDPAGTAVLPCCGMTSGLPNQTVMGGLECMSKCLKTTIFISSGWRTSEQNIQTPGASDTSYHISGLAADVHVPPSLDKLRKAATECGFFILPTAYPNRIHIDIRGGRTPKTEADECACKKIREGN